VTICKTVRHMLRESEASVPSVCATVSASINPLARDRLRCCDRYIPCQRSLAVEPLNSRPAMSGSPSRRRSVRRVNNKPQSRLAIVPCMLYYRSFVCPVLSVCDVGVLWPNGWMDQDETWHGDRPRPRPHYVRWGPSRLPKGARSPQIFGPCLLWPNGRPSQLLLSTCFT